VYALVLDNSYQIRIHSVVVNMWCILLSYIKVIDHDLVNCLYWGWNIFLMVVVQIGYIQVLDLDRGDVDLDKGLMGDQCNCPMMLLIGLVNCLLRLVILGMGCYCGCNRIHLDR
jgi:hypothetical protein